MAMPKGWTKLKAHGIPALMDCEKSARYRLRHPERIKEYNQLPRSRALKDARKNIRRAQKHGAFVERVFRGVVLERDQGICGICQEAVDPQNWHLDHIIPLSKGGQHSYANTQVTHPVCNLRKGGR